MENISKLHMQLVKHILLLQKVIAHLEMTRRESVLDSYINNYRKRIL